MASRRGAGLAFLLLAAGSAAAGEPARTEVTRAGPAVDIRASIESPAPPELCYAVLADFDRLAEFIPGMVSSRIVSGPGAPLRLRQVGRTALGFGEYLVDVTLAVHATPPERIDFDRVAGNLRQMRGNWRVAGVASGCEIRYEARIEPEFSVPPLVGPLLVRRQVQRQFEGLAAEIARRAARP